MDSCARLRARNRSSAAETIQLRYESGLHLQAGLRLLGAHIKAGKTAGKTEIISHSDEITGTDICILRYRACLDDAGYCGHMIFRRLSLG